MERRLVVAAICIVATTTLPVSSAWNQLGGDSDRSGVFFSADHDLDVAAWGSLTTNSSSLILNWREQGMVVTPHGTMALTVSVGPGGNYGQSCSFVIVDSFRANATRRGEPFQCGLYSSITAYDPVRDQILVCSGNRADSPVLRALDAETLEERWHISPIPDLGHTEDPGTNSWSSLPWYCSGAMVDMAKAEVVLSFFMWSASAGDYTNRITKINLETGQVIWAVSIPHWRYFAETQPPTLPEPPVTSAEQDGVTFPMLVTQTESGYIVSGYVGCKCTFNNPPRHGMRQAPEIPQRQDAFTWAAAWLSPSGEIRGTALSFDPARTTEAQENSQLQGGSIWAAASGQHAAMALGDHLMLINPADPAPYKDLPLEGLKVPDGSSWWPAPKWWNEFLVLPLPEAIRVYDGGSLAPRWTALESTGWRISDTLIAPTRDLFVLAAREQDQRTSVFRLDLEDGTVIQEIPLPLLVNLTDVSNVGFNLGGWFAHFLPNPGEPGLLVWDQRGNYILLGQPLQTHRPNGTVSNAFPRPGEPVTLKVIAPTGLSLARYNVHWGEGSSETYAAHENATHVYRDAGVHNIRITAIYDGGLTATNSTLVDVGGSPPVPPVRLSKVQTAFAPQNENRTWGIVGVVLVVVGALVTLFQRWFSRRVVRREMKRLDQIRAQSTTDLSGAVRALEVYRTALRGKLAKGRISDTHFSVLELRSNSLLAAMRGRIMASFAGRLTTKFQFGLEAALQDDVVSPGESSSLLQALDGEKGLTPAERAAVQTLLRA